MGALPKCPDCGIAGTDYIMSTESQQRSKAGDAWFEIVHCTECGHVYGTFPKIVLEPKPFTPSFAR